MRLRELDSVRGLAAGLVVLTHSEYILRPVAEFPWMGYLAIHFLPLGRAPVIVFFVLSGFVLTISLTQPNSPNFVQFVVRRFCRIYFPFLAAIFLSICWFYLVRPIPISGQSDWFNSTWSDGVDGRVVIRHLLMLGRFHDATLDNVVWSLWYELRISFLMPFLIVMTGAFGTPAAIVVFGAVTVAIELSFALLHSGSEPYYSWDLPSAVLITAHFAPLFILGMLAALHHDVIGDKCRKISRAYRFCIWMLSIALLNTTSDFVIGFGALMIICLASSLSNGRSWLLSHPLQWLGRVSFSLYLTHLPILIGLYYAFHNSIYPLWIILGGWTVSLIIAEVFYRAVEAPSVQLGHLLTIKRASNNLAQ